MRHRHHDALAKIRHNGESLETRLDLTSMGLTDLPAELAGLRHLETLDLSGNRLARLPEFLAELPRLKRLFLTKNQFAAWPEALAGLPALEMVSLKSNLLEHMPDDGCLPPSVVWLILTDNRLAALPESFGRCLPALRKLALAGNRLERLPASFAALSRLELVRLGLNRLQVRPPELEAMPRLAWLGIGGNPYAEDLPARREAALALSASRLDPAGYELCEPLGAGASGVVHRACNRKGPGDVAVKVFRGVSSDGHPRDELEVAARAALGAPAGIIPFRGWLPEESLGMVMDFIGGARPLGLVPSFASVTRDTYPEGLQFEPDFVRSALLTLARAEAHLVGRGIIHGDFYAHNVLVGPGGDVCLGDWGAASFMGPGDAWMESCEVRAYGCLADELLERCPLAPRDLVELRDRCLAERPAGRPRFRDIVDCLGG